jgi:hypothetical protein
LGVNGTGAFSFDTSDLGSGPIAATFTASPDRATDTLKLSVAAQQSLTNGQIASDVMHGARPVASKSETSAPDNTAAASGTAQAATTQATTQKAGSLAATQTGDNPDRRVLGSTERQPQHHHRRRWALR